MFLYMVMPGRDTETKRLAQIEYLSSEFGVEAEAYEYTLVDPKKMVQGKKRKLFILGHGSTDSYMGQSAEVMYNFLIDCGLSSEHFSEIWLMPCFVGMQEQDNSVTENFARALKTKLHQNEETQDIKLYAPRGKVTSYYTDNTYSKCTSVIVEKDGKEYGFYDGGWLLVGGSGVW
ncbi:hypothetical protein [Halarcobacter ebronensis]|uniref:Uncharacterized protein n=1 Tax=Halarcobacter ebronensis TaxID=1462615 RepID=A0A4Q1APA2_9BACT|nr:hypothetical protein [Halarcobacter ebronensis]QKF81724.1 hypothetical protein AEBR_1230 [Halarcobacter ebronensis]RXK04598.1 hypothetical protein CRV07_10610 [Halarcobacter ebronensis]